MSHTVLKPGPQRDGSASLSLLNRWSGRFEVYWEAMMRRFAREDDSKWQPMMAGEKHGHERLTGDTRRSAKNKEGGASDRTPKEGEGVSNNGARKHDYSDEEWDEHCCENGGDTYGGASSSAASEYRAIKAHADSTFRNGGRARAAAAFT